MSTTPTHDGSSASLRDRMVRCANPRSARANEDVSVHGAHTWSGSRSRKIEPRTKLLCVVGGLLPYLVAAGWQTGQGNEECRGIVGGSDRGSSRRRRDVGGTARICARNLAGNNKGQQPAGNTTFLAGTRNDGGTQPRSLREITK